ncbi:GAF domain-containing protein [Nakamurella sp. GG22]
MTEPSAPGDTAPLTLADRYYAAFNARDLDAWLEILDEDVEVVVDARVMRGRQAALAYMSGILQAYPGVTVSSRRVVAASSDAVVSEFQLTNPIAVPEAHGSSPTDPTAAWNLDGVNCEVLRVRGNRLVSLHSYYSPAVTDRTPIALVPSRAEAARIAHRQAALGRVATQVAGGATERDLVAVINEVIAEFAGVDVSLMMRVEADDTAVLIAVSGLLDGPVPIGERLVISDDIRAVRDSGRTLRFGANGWPLQKSATHSAPGQRLRWCVGVPIMLHGRVWGISLLGSSQHESFADDIEDGIIAFTQLASTALANAQANDELRERAREQTELLHVAEIAAAGADPMEVFAAVVRSASTVLNGQLTTLMRFVDSEVADVLAFSGPGIPATGERLVIDPGSVTARVQRTGRPARIDNYRDAPGNRFANDIAKLHASAGVPVSVDGQLWGVLAATSMDGPLPSDIESRLTQFAGTVATAIAGAQARAELRALAEKQAALRRVAEVIARAPEDNQIYDAVCAEAARIIDEDTTLVRLDEANSCTVVGSSSDMAAIGTRIELPTDDDSVVSEVLRTRSAARVERFVEAPEQHGYHLDGLTSSVGVPIIVGVRVWGVLSAATARRRLLTTAEQSLQQFGGLMAVAVANAEAHGRLRDFADEQAALRRVAELAAHDAPAEEVLRAVAVEASGLAGVEFGMVLKYEGMDGANRIVALNGAPDNFAVGMRAPGTGESAVQRDWGTGRVARVDDLGEMTGLWPGLAHERGFKASAGVPIVIHGVLWGALIVCGRDGPVPRAVEEHLVNFAELAATAIGAANARQELRLLADEQAALRRVAELAAREAPAEDVLAAVAAEASALAGVEFTTLLRYGRDGSTVIVAAAGAPEGITVGMRSPGTGDAAVQRVWRTGRPARVDKLAEMTGVWPLLAHSKGFTASAAVPVVLHGQLWGALVVVGRAEAFPLPIEEHLANFADLAATAVSAADARQGLRQLAGEQAAVRRVAELVARSVELDQIFNAVTTETSSLLGDAAATLLRYERAADATVVASTNDRTPRERRMPVKPSFERDPDVLRPTGPRVPGGIPVDAGDRVVKVPVTVEGHTWGALTVVTSGPPLPAGSEEKLRPFAELTAVAVVNAENKSKLTASRARVIATADETRRRIQRDVHDGAQQRLVHTIIVLKLAREAALEGRSTNELVNEALSNAERASKELRDIVHGILPASLTRGGLRSGLESLLLDLALPVELTVGAPRLSPQIETTAYFIVAEAITNVVKHAQANRATVDIKVENSTLIIHIADDGVGGAVPGDGSGLTGLLDRVEAGNGTLTVTSPAGGGTMLRAKLPLDGQSYALIAP